MGALTPPNSGDLDVADATFACPDVTSFCHLDELGLRVVGQRVEPDRVVLACRVAEAGEPDRWCRRCGCEGTARDSVTRRLAHEPLGWRPTMLLVTVLRYRCGGCGHVWRQDTSRAAEPRAKLSRRGLRSAAAAPRVPAARTRPGSGRSARTRPGGCWAAPPRPGGRPPRRAAGGHAPTAALIRRPDSRADGRRRATAGAGSRRARRPPGSGRAAVAPGRGLLCAGCVRYADGIGHTIAGWAGSWGVFGGPLARSRRHGAARAGCTGGGVSALRASHANWQVSASSWCRGRPARRGSPQLRADFGAASCRFIGR
jgi:hypothetical protein